MRPPTPTGRRRYRVHSPMFGADMLVLQIEETYESINLDCGRFQSGIYTAWRDATIGDLTLHERPEFPKTQSGPDD